ncbi:MAG TPA: hypothetical protein VFT50_01410 [Baekduia sp.]|nr:hypothetical protein [Baekduia sp.]
MPWLVLAGIVEWWADEGRRDVGRRRFHEETGPTGCPGPAPPHVIDHIRAAFVAQHQPWRLIEMSLPSKNPLITPFVVSWADEATAVLRGDPAKQHVVRPNESHGDLGAQRMLNPSALETLVPKPWTARFVVPGDLLELDVSVLPELVTLGADHYEVNYDRDLDILTTWTAIIDGAPAQRVSLREVTSLARAAVDREI